MDDVTEGQAKSEADDPKKPERPMSEAWRRLIERGQVTFVPAEESPTFVLLGGVPPKTVNPTEHE